MRDTLVTEHASPVLRAYRATDRDAVRDICCRTAFRNVGARAVLDDPELFGDYWTAYYTDHEPESITIAEHEGVAIGYLTGCANTRRYIRIMARRIVPSVLARLAWRASCGRYRGQPRARAFMRWMARRSWREAPPVDIDRFPAHYHANILREGSGHGLYSAMALTFLDAMQARGVSGVHGQVIDYRERGAWQRFVAEFFVEHPGAPIESWERECTLGRDVLGVKRALMNRAWGAPIDVFRQFLEAIARRHGL